MFVIVKHHSDHKSLIKCTPDKTLAHAFIDIENNKVKNYEQKIRAYYQKHHDYPKDMSWEKYDCHYEVETVEDL